MTGGPYTGGIAHAEKFETGDRFGLSWVSAQVDDGSMGRGGSQIETYFLTAEGRAYFIQAEAAREHCAELAQKLEWAERELAEIKSRSWWRRLLNKPNRARWQE